MREIPISKSYLSWRENKITAQPTKILGKTGKSDVEQFSNSENKCWNVFPTNCKFLLLVYL